jgi:hypothetical protein
VSSRRKLKRRLLRRDEVSVTGEAERIIQCAIRREGRIVTVGQLLFFSTETGDAWVLDPSEELARCLAREGDPLPLGVLETPDSFGVEWDLAYGIEGDEIRFHDQLGREQIVLGYPVREIRRAIGRMR